MPTLDLDQLNTIPTLLQHIDERLTRIEERQTQMMAKLPQRLVSHKQAAEELNLSLSTVRRYCEQGKLREIRIGGKPRVDLTGVVATNDDDIAELVSERRRI